ncbi:MAG: alpha-amylase [Lachnospiraceae bacterium]|nr:alpha-amylase [Lachnospiraceae bacterium]
MKKKLLAIFFSLALICTVGGCQQTSSSFSSNDSAGNQEMTDEAAKEEQKEKDEESRKPQESYSRLFGAKDRTLQVQEDNYRTYYEVFLYSFYDSDKDGIGDIGGLIEKLDYLNDGDDDSDTDLGVNGIWLMPIFQSTTYHKYDVVDYYTIDEEYGSLEDFKKLIQECDKRGIKVILDMAFNHTSSQHAWFQSALKSLAVEDCGSEECTLEELCKKHNKYCEYYNFTQEKPSEVYYETGVDGWYYEGKFWSEMPDLNLENENVRRELEAVMQYWLDLGVGGFRLDAVGEYYSGATLKNVEVLRWITDYVKDDAKDNYLVSEVWQTFDNYSKYYDSGVDSSFDFAFAGPEGKIAKVIKQGTGKNTGRGYVDAMASVETTIKGYNENAIDAPFYTNHDMARSAGYYQNNLDQMKFAQAMNLMMSGNAFLYYGEEIGMSGSGKDENKRAPFLWSSTDDTGMTAGPIDMEEVKSAFPSMEEQQTDEGSMLNYVKAAIRLRNVFPEIARGSVEAVEEITDTAIAAMKKTYGKESCIILMNTTEEEKIVVLPKTVGCETLAGELTVSPKSIILEGETITLPAYGVAVLK